MAKIRRETPPFSPVILTLENQAEVDLLRILLGYSYRSAIMNSNSSELTHERREAAVGVSFGLFNTIISMYD